MILYHYPTSPFARRVRLALALKGLNAELRDARADPEHATELRRLHPMHTVPLLIDDERVVADSTAICHYLDRKLPTPALWPQGLPGAEAFELAALMDGAIQTLIDLGLRYHALHDHPRFEEVRQTHVGRAQRALDAAAEKVSAHGLANGPLCGNTWSGADIVVYTSVAWLEGLPKRAPIFPAAQQVIDLGWSLPAALRSWADQHRQRPDVLALG
jgi:glutathione S-transferase